MSKNQSVLVFKDNLKEFVIVKRRNFFIIILFCGILLSNWLFFSSKKSSRFSLKEIQSSFAFSSEWVTSSLKEKKKLKLHQIFSQDFNYLASGAECFCFCSKDGKYVLKFFKMKHLSPKPWLKYFFLPIGKKYRFRKYEKRILRCKNLFKNYKTAYEKYKKETGLIYIHLNKTKEIDSQITLVDRYQKRHKIDLSKFEFVLQKKASLVGSYLNQLMELNKKEEAIQALRALFFYIIKQCREGFIDQDSGVFHNYGFIENQVIHFDVGRMQLKQGEENRDMQQEITRVGNKLEKWIKNHHPSLLQDLQEIRTCLKTSSSLD